MDRYSPRRVLDINDYSSILIVSIAGHCVPMLTKGSRLCCLGGQRGWSGRHPMNTVTVIATESLDCSCA